MYKINVLDHDLFVYWDLNKKQTQLQGTKPPACDQAKTMYCT